LGYKARILWIVRATWCDGREFGACAFEWILVSLAFRSDFALDLLASFRPKTGRWRVPVGRFEKGRRGKGSVVPVITSVKVAEDCISLIQKVSYLRACRIATSLGPRSFACLLGMDLKRFCRGCLRCPLGSALGGGARIATTARDQLFAMWSVVRLIWACTYSYDVFLHQLHISFPVGWLRGSMEGG